MASQLLGAYRGQRGSKGPADPMAMFDPPFSLLCSLLILDRDKFADLLLSQRLFRLLISVFPHLASFLGVVLPWGRVFFYLIVHKSLDLS